MRRSKLGFLVTAALLVTGMMTNTGYARERTLRLEFNGEFIRNVETLRLKQEIRGEYPRINIEDLELLRVRLVATPDSRASRFNRAKASLRVGRFETDMRRLDRRVTVFRNPSYSSEGAWQLNLEGRMTLNRVEVVVEGNRADRLYYEEVDSYKIDKFGINSVTIPINERNVRAIKLYATRNDARIDSVRVVFGNGNSRYLDVFEGRLKENREKIEIFNADNGRAVRKLIIRASTSLIGSRAKIHVAVGLSRR